MQHCNSFRKYTSKPLYLFYTHLRRCFKTNIRLSLVRGNLDHVCQDGHQHLVTCEIPLFDSSTTNEDNTKLICNFTSYLPISSKLMFTKICSFIFPIFWRVLKFCRGYSPQCLLAATSTAYEIVTITYLQYRIKIASISKILHAL